MFLTGTGNNLKRFTVRTEADLKVRVIQLVQICQLYVPGGYPDYFHCDVMHSAAENGMQRTAFQST